MNQTIGFIGCGKMAQAMIGGMIRSKTVSATDILASARTIDTRTRVSDLFGIGVTASNTEVAERADLLFLGIAPNLHKAVLTEVKESLKDDAMIITIAAGLTTEDIVSFAGRPLKVIRTMPNTPSLAGEGMTAISVNSLVEESDLKQVQDLFHSFGKTEVISEELMDSIPAISGSSPAYVYMMIEAMADGGVRQGLKRDQAYRLAAQAVLGAAKMVLETGKHPGELKDQVTSPGGATVAAVEALERGRFRGAVLEAMESCTARVIELGENK
ncbi:pyrroline-5-carboxylate reductase [Jeotgalibacillus sp. R-1-5s-1]|uniref:pyrroline-5-carboxylate reductase n=1 Tax=Jeotgalibacillus sp. R-1-5s-1 TaxID=2555897 RepID=UPI00106B0C4F|nr:pyrroline-5-carboxylate reductase [Jeotgalibacillus sp. R-1-5s-1]TFD92843.1 pyrroline-5-carboxylate reductase [Jeotgalibacillus sp. R-1-5s-1]